MPHEVNSEQSNPHVRKLFASNSGGPEMAAPVLWTPGKIVFFLQENPMPIKFLVLGGVVFWVFGGGGECRFYFYGREDFSDFFPMGE